MAALIGMTLQLQRPELFAKMVLVAPAMMPQGVNVVTRFAVYFANAFGFGHKLLLRLPRYVTGSLPRPLSSPYLGPCLSCLPAAPAQVQYSTRDGGSTG